jgi:hypothetical protein
VFMPTDAAVRVKLGDLTIAGSTPIADLPPR